MISIQKKIKKIPKKLLIYKGYNLSQALIRYHTFNIRAYKVFKSKNKKFTIRNIFLLLISLFSKIKLSLNKRKSNIIVISNTKYKIQKALDCLSKKKNIAILQDFNHKIFERYNHQDYHFINKFLFLKLNKKKINQSKKQDEFLMLQNKIIFFEKIFNFYKPNLVYIVEGDSINDALIGQICKKKRIKCFCIQHGYNPILFDSPILPKFSFKNYFFDFIFLADSYKSAMFLKKRKLIDKFRVLKQKTCSIKLEYKKNILFGIPTISPNENLNESIIIKIAQNIIYFSKKHHNIKILVRLHPDGLTNEIIFKKISNLKNIEFHNPHKISLKESFKSAKISCFVFGTSLIADAINNYCFPVVLVDKKNSYTFDGLKKNRIAYLTNKEKNFRNEVSKLIENSKELKTKQKIIQKYLDGLNTKI